MVKHLVLLLSGCVTLLVATNMRRVAQIPSGPDAGVGVVCCDSDHDSLPEFIFHRYYTTLAGNQGNEYWEHQGWNRFSLVHADTGAYPPPPGITTGNAIPFAAGDIDGDGLTDIVCITVGFDSTKSGTAYDVLMTLESPDSFSYPCSLSWYYRFSDLFVIPIPTHYTPDLDGDGHMEVLCGVPSLSMGASVWENTGNDQNELVWNDTVHDGYRFTFGDFDLDGRMNFATSTLGSAGIASVWECTGDDQYEVVYQDTVRKPNGADLFTTSDIDGDGKPEFYVAYYSVPRGMMYLYMWEADQIGSDVYHRTPVDSLGFGGDDWGRISECGDIDGDGVDECIWTTPDVIKMYKAVGDDQLQEVWHWNNDHGVRSLVSTVYDINGDGYNELITAGNAKISIFEIDAVDLVTPNGGSCQPGDTVLVRWVTNSPPRCDSLSLLLRRDSLWNLDTIALGLPATDTQYQWIIPASVPDTGRVVVIAYGPSPQPSPNGRGSEGEGLPRLGQVAWQFDISDSIIDFTGGGVAEGTRSVPQHWSLSISPNPARGAISVRYDVPSQSRVSIGVYDAGGRLVRSLSEGNVAPGRYEAKLPSGILPAGVYFCTLDTGAKRICQKVVLTE